MREGPGVSYNKLMHIGIARISAGRGGCNTPLPADTRCVFQVGACLHPPLLETHSHESEDSWTYVSLVMRQANI